MIVGLAQASSIASWLRGSGLVREGSDEEVEVKNLHDID
jgi:hypothetical protein